MSKEGLSRREFVQGGAAAAGGLWLAIHFPRPRALQAAEQSGKPAFFSEQEWVLVEAITARIIPTDQDPGAREAHCVNFIDKALVHEDAKLARVYREGLPGVDGVARKRFEKPFVELDPKQQNDVLSALEAGSASGWPSGELASAEFFETVRVHTLWGFLADPRYGGNRDYVGWKVMGYPGPHHHLGGYTPEQMLGKAPIEPVWQRKKPGSETPSHG